jgi:transcription initiation factor IIE alpha subunit
MKKTIIALAILLAANTGAFAQTYQHDSTKTHKMTTSKGVKYTCTMHPKVVMDKPGKCPKCGMTLVKMKPGKKNSKMKGDMKDRKM